MRSVSAIIVINLAYVACLGWNPFIPTMEFDHDIELPNMQSLDWKPNELMGILPNITTHFLQQPLDHFDPKENRTFKVWYQQSLDFWKPNGPIYIWILRQTHYEFPYTEYYLINFTLTSVLAKETNGAMFISHQRYYGKSKPPIPRSADNYFKYLHTTQQLADTAELIKYLKSKPEFQSSKVVLLAWNEAANLATWMRLVYPNLVDAAVASSAPLLAKKDAKELYEYTAEVYDKYGYKGCINNLEEQFNWFRDALKNDTELDFYKLKHKIFKDNNFTLTEDQQLYMFYEYGSYLYNARQQIGIMAIKFCQRLRVLTSFCIDYHYERAVKILKFYRSPEGYQACNEYGQFATASAKKRPFDNFLNLNIYLKLCNDMYGVDEKKMDKGIAQTNLMYGGLTPNVTNVVFTQGDVNPYKWLGIQLNLSDSAPAFVLKEEGNINIIFVYGGKERLEVIHRVMTLIKKWIGL